mmetsp:Transcript_88710/g.185461  ORF Transcript_88710/g.185461 Transcript_88710/m.185461 type:complete len:226 (-) Transcript_88710:1187-1864(-)
MVAFGQTILAFSCVEDHFLLRNGQGATVKAGLAHLAANVIHQEDVVLDLLPGVPSMDGRRLNVLPIQHLLDLVVVQSAHRADGCLHEPRLVRALLHELTGVFLQPEEGGEGQLGFRWVEGAQMIAKTVRQHRQYSINQVHRRRSELSLLVRQTTKLDEVADISDVHTDFDFPSLWVVVDMNGVIQIFGCCWIDREDPLLSEILATGRDLLLEVPLCHSHDFVDFV